MFCYGQKTFKVKVIRINPTFNGLTGIEELVLITCIIIMFKIVVTNCGWEELTYIRVIRAYNTGNYNKKSMKLLMIKTIII